MALLDFPDTPVAGDVYGSSGTLWRWDGTRWASSSGSSGATGALAYAQVVATQAGIGTTWTDVAGLSATWLADPSRTYRVTGHGELQSTVANDPMYLGIYTGATRANRSGVIEGPANQPHNNTVEVVLKGLSGSVTYKIMAAAGTGSLTVLATADMPAFILVEDITYDGGAAAGAPPFPYQVPRIVYTGNVTTDANGEFAVGTGFQPSAAFCIGTQFGYPTIAILNLITSAQVSFRMKNFPANTPAGPSTIGVSYVIFGPAL